MSLKSLVRWNFESHCIGFFGRLTVNCTDSVILWIVRDVVRSVIWSILGNKGTNIQNEIMSIKITLMPFNGFKEAYKRIEMLEKTYVSRKERSDRARAWYCRTGRDSLRRIRNSQFQAWRTFDQVTYAREHLLYACYNRIRAIKIWNKHDEDRKWQNWWGWNAKVKIAVPSGFGGPEYNQSI